MKYNLYQVQLESENCTYCLVVATNDYDAVEIAEIYVACKFDDFSKFHVGGYCHIGYSYTDGVMVCKRREYR